MEFEIHNYFSKEARNLQIVKEFVIDFMKTATLEDIQKDWLNANVVSRAIAPLQTLKFATCNLKGWPLEKATAIPFFYKFLKTNPIMGDILNVKDDLDTASVAIESFKQAHPEIFG